MSYHPSWHGHGAAALPHPPLPSPPPATVPPATTILCKSPLTRASESEAYRHATQTQQQAYGSNSYGVAVATPPAYHHQPQHSPQPQQPLRHSVSPSPPFSGYISPQHFHPSSSSSLPPPPNSSYGRPLGWQSPPPPPGAYLSPSSSYYQSPPPLLHASSTPYSPSSVSSPPTLVAYPTPSFRSYHSHGGGGGTNPSYSIPLGSGPSLSNSSSPNVPTLQHPASMPLPFHHQPLSPPHSIYDPILTPSSQRRLLITPPPGPPPQPPSSTTPSSAAARSPRLNAFQQRAPATVQFANPIYTSQSPSTTTLYPPSSDDSYRSISPYSAISQQHLPTINTSMSSSSSTKGAETPPTSTSGYSPLSSPYGSRRNSSVANRPLLSRPSTGYQSGYQYSDGSQGSPVPSYLYSSPPSYEPSLNGDYIVPTFLRSQSERASPVSHVHPPLQPRQPSVKRSSYDEIHSRGLGSYTATGQHQQPQYYPSHGLQPFAFQAPPPLMTSTATAQQIAFARKQSPHFHATGPRKSVIRTAATTESGGPSTHSSPISMASISSNSFPPPTELSLEAGLGRSPHDPSIDEDDAESDRRRRRYSTEDEKESSSYSHEPSPSLHPHTRLTPQTLQHVNRGFEPSWITRTSLYGLSLPPSLRAAKHRLKPGERLVRPRKKRMTPTEKAAQEEVLQFLNVPGVTVAAADPDSPTVSTAINDPLSTSRDDIEEVKLEETKSPETGGLTSDEDDRPLKSIVVDRVGVDSLTSTNASSSLHLSSSASSQPSTRASSRASQMMAPVEEVALRELRTKLMDKAHQKVFHVPDPTKGLEVTEEAVEEVVAAGGGASSALRQVVQMEVHQIRFHNPKELTQAVHILTLPLTLIDMDADADEVYITDVSSQHGAGGGVKELLSMPKEARDYVVNRSKVQNLVSSVLMQHEELQHEQAMITHGAASRHSSRRSTAKRQSGKLIQMIEGDDLVDEDDMSSMMVNGDGHARLPRVQQVTMMDFNSHMESAEADELHFEQSEARAEEELFARLAPALNRSVSNASLGGHRPLFVTEMNFTTSNEEDAYREHIKQVIHASFPHKQSALRHIMALQLQPELQFDNFEQVVKAITILSANEPSPVPLTLSGKSSAQSGGRRSVVSGKMIQHALSNAPTSGSGAASSSSAASSASSPQQHTSPLTLSLHHQEEKTSSGTDENESPAMRGIASPSFRGPSRATQSKAQTIQLLEQEVNEGGFSQLVSEYVLNHSKVQLEMAYIDDMAQDALASAAVSPQNTHPPTRARHKSFQVHDMADLVIEEMAMGEEEMLKVEIVGSDDAAENGLTASTTTPAELLQNRIARKQVLNKLCDADNNQLFIEPHIVMTPTEVASMIDPKQGGAKPMDALKHLISFEMERIKFENPKQLISAVKTLALPLVEENYTLNEVEYEIEKANLPAKAQSYVLKHSIVQLEIAKVEKPKRKKKSSKTKKRSSKRQPSILKHPTSMVITQLPNPQSLTMVEEKNSPSLNALSPSSAQRQAVILRASSDGGSDELEAELTENKSYAAVLAANHESSEAHLRNVLKKRLSSSTPFFAPREMAWSDEDISALVAMGGNSAEAVLQHILSMELVPGLVFETPAQFIRTVQLLHMKPVEEDEEYLVEGSVEQETVNMLQELAEKDATATEAASATNAATITGENDLTKSTSKTTTATLSDSPNHSGLEEKKDSDSSSHPSPAQGATSPHSSIKKPVPQITTHELKLLDPDEQLANDLEWQEMQVAGLPKAAQEYLMQHFQVELQLAKVTRAAKGLTSRGTSRAPSRAPSRGAGGFDSKHNSMKNIRDARRSLHLFGTGGSDEDMLVELVDHTPAVPASLTESQHRRKKNFMAGVRAKSIHITHEKMDESEDLKAFVEGDSQRSSTEPNSAVTKEKTTDEKASPLAIAPSLTASNPSPSPATAASSSSSAVLPPPLLATPQVTREDVANLFEQGGAGDMTIKHLQDIMASGQSFQSTAGLISTIKTMHDDYLKKDVKARRELHQRLIEKQSRIVSPSSAALAAAAATIGNTKSPGLGTPRGSFFDGGHVPGSATSPTSSAISPPVPSSVRSPDISRMIDLAGGASEALQTIDSLEEKHITFDSAKQLLSAFKVLALPMEQVNLDEVAVELEKGHYDQAAVSYILTHLQDRLQEAKEITIEQGGSDNSPHSGFSGRSIHMLPADDGGEELSVELVGGAGGVGSSRSSSNRASRVTSPAPKAHSRKSSMYKGPGGGEREAPVGAPIRTPGHSRNPSMRQQLAQKSKLPINEGGQQRNTPPMGGSPRLSPVTAGGNNSPSMSSPVPVHPATFLLLGTTAQNPGGGGSNGSPSNSVSHSPQSQSPRLIGRSRSVSRPGSIVLPSSSVSLVDQVRSPVRSPTLRASSGHQGSPHSILAQLSPPLTDIGSGTDGDLTKLDLGGPDGSILGATPLATSAERSSPTKSPTAFPNSPLRRQRKKGKSVAFSHEEVLHITPNLNRAHARSNSLGTGALMGGRAIDFQMAAGGGVGGVGSGVTGVVSPKTATSLRSSLRNPFTTLSIIPDSPARGGTSGEPKSPQVMSPVSASLQILSGAATDYLPNVNVTSGTLPSALGGGARRVKGREKSVFFNEDNNLIQTRPFTPVSMSTIESEDRQTSSNPSEHSNREHGRGERAMSFTSTFSTFDRERNERSGESEEEGALSEKENGGTSAAEVSNQRTPSPRPIKSSGSFSFQTTPVSLDRTASLSLQSNTDVEHLQQSPLEYPLSPEKLPQPPLQQQLEQIDEQMEVSSATPELLTKSGSHSPIIIRSGALSPPPPILPTNVLPPSPIEVSTPSEVRPETPISVFTPIVMVTPPPATPVTSFTPPSTHASPNSTPEPSSTNVSPATNKIDNPSFGTPSSTSSVKPPLASNPRKPKESNKIIVIERPRLLTAHHSDGDPPMSSPTTAPIQSPSQQLTATQAAQQRHRKSTKSASYAQPTSAFIRKTTISGTPESPAMRPIKKMVNAVNRRMGSTFDKPTASSITKQGPDKDKLAVIVSRDAGTSSLTNRRNKPNTFAGVAQAAMERKTASSQLSIPLKPHHQTSHSLSSIESENSDDVPTSLGHSASGSLDPDVNLRRKMSFEPSGRNSSRTRSDSPLTGSPFVIQVDHHDDQIQEGDENRSQSQTHSTSNSASNSRRQSGRRDSSGLPNDISFEELLEQAQQRHSSLAGGGGGSGVKTHFRAGSVDSVGSAHSSSSQPTSPGDRGGGTGDEITPTPPPAITKPTIRLFTQSAMQVEEELAPTIPDAYNLRGMSPAMKPLRTPLPSKPQPESTPQEKLAFAAVDAWLAERGFSESNRADLSSFSFADLYALEKSDLIDLLGKDGELIYSRLRTHPPTRGERAVSTATAPSPSMRPQTASSFARPVLNKVNSIENGSSTPNPTTPNPSSGGGGSSDEDEGDSSSMVQAGPMDAAEINRRVAVRKRLQRRKIEIRLAKEEKDRLARASKAAKDRVKAQEREEAEIEAERVALSKETQDFIRGRQEERAAEEAQRKQGLLDEIRAKEAEEEAIRRKKLEEEEEIRRIQRMNHLKPTMAAAVKLASLAGTPMHAAEHMKLMAQPIENETGGMIEYDENGTPSLRPQTDPFLTSIDSAQEYIEFHRAKRAELYAQTLARKAELESLKKALLTEKDVEFQSRVEEIKIKRKAELESEQRALMARSKKKEELRIKQMTDMRAQWEKELQRKSAEIDARIAAAQLKSFETEQQRLDELNTIRSQHDQDVARQLSEHAARVEKHRSEKAKEKALLLKKAAALKELYANEASEEIRAMVAVRDEARERAAKINQALPYTPKLAAEFNSKLVPLKLKLDAADGER